MNDDEHLEFEKELRLLLNEHASVSEESERFDLPIEKILESLPEHGEIICDEDAYNVLAVHRHSSGKDTPSRSRKSSIYKKSISFLLKKAFVCGGGFTPSPIIAPILKDPFPDPNLDRSTMEKILKAMLRKKKPPQRQRYLDKSRTSKNEQEKEVTNANNWVKTDSEFVCHTSFW
ncbi:hypothetical protein C2S52_022516 [Perilla frutescens var. hirtella]|nr:hypothetical protein C2S52_022516 [Perilla frutescens var. hirtella]